jgi:hypothetical protein
LGRRFYHKASAYGLSGKITWPVEESISVRPSCALPPNGGFSQNREKDFNLHDLISFKSALTQVSGGDNDEPLEGATVRADNNISVSVIEGFNLLNVVSIDRIVSRITTRRFHHRDEVEIVLVGTRFEGFRISGVKLDIELHTDIFVKHPTFSVVRQHLTAMSGFKEKGPQEVFVPIVKSIKPERESEDFKINGNEVEIAHVGRLFLAELLVSSDYKNLNMIRFKLGCPIGAEGTIGGGMAGGSVP